MDSKLIEDKSNDV